MKNREILCFIKEQIIESFFAKKKTVYGQIYFYNIWWKYSDNTRALAEAYHRMFPQYKLIYEINEHTNTSEIPSFLYLVKSGTKESLQLKSTSMVVIDNDWGSIKKSCVGMKGKIQKYLYSKRISKDTLYVSTSHGTPVKRIGCDAVNDYYDDFLTSTKCMYLLDQFSVDVFDRITKKQISNLLVTGSPRNDKLFVSDEEKNIIKNKFGISGKRVILFAPTFRTSIENGKVSFVGAQEYIENVISLAPKLLETLKERFGGDWILGLRVHPGIKLSNIFLTNECIFNANQYDDMAEYLTITDVLVTDYSSCAIDFLLTKRPCFFVWQDLDKYCSEQRGLYFTEEFPFPTVDKTEKLISSINSFSYDDYSKKVLSFKQLIGMSACENASETVILDIQKLLDRRRKPNE